MIHGAIVLMLVLWLVLTVGRQLPGRVGAAVVACDIAHLVPLWTFFAPRPISSDLHVLYRDLDAASTPSRWTEVPFSSRGRIRHGLWNPDKRLSKGVSDLIDHLLELQQGLRARPEAIRLSIPYLALANLVCSRPRSEGASAREFIVVQTHGYHARHELRVLFRSDRHAIA